MALSVPNSADLVNRCAAAVTSDYDNCGAITQCALSVLTPDQINSIYMSNAAGTAGGTGAVDDRFRVFGDVFAADFEGRAVGVRPNGLYDFLLSQSKILSPKKMSVTEIAPGMWELTPYIKMKRERAMTEDYWVTKNHTSSTWTLGATVILDFAPQTPDGWRQGSVSEILPDPLYFPVGQRLFLSGHHTTNAGLYRIALEVTESPAAGQTPPANSVTVACIVTAIDVGTTGAGVPIAPGAPATPPLTGAGVIVGLTFRGTANVSDYEKFCSEIPKVKNESLVPFWVETTRYSMCHDDLTEGYMKALLANNDYYREWIHVDSVQHNRRIIEDFQKRHAYTILFNSKRVGQTLADYQKAYTGAAGSGLPRITTTPPGAKGFASLNKPFFNSPAGANLNAGLAIGNSFNSGGMVDASGAGRCIGYKANAEGIYPQLVECGRVIDMIGGNLDLYKFLNTLYVIQRARKNAGVPADVIEVVTDSRTAFAASYAMATYFGKQVNAAASTYHNQASADWYKVCMQLGKECPTNWGFKCTSFPLDYPVCELRFVYNEALDDVLMSYKKAGMEAAGRFFWLVDWSAIYVGIIENNTVVNETGSLQDMAKADDTYMCVMKAHGRSQKLVSQAYTVIVEDETTSLIFENIGSQVFAATAAGVSRAADLSSTYINL